MTAAGDNPLRRLWARLSRANERRARAVAAMWSTGFWCAKHRAMVERSGVDALMATSALAYGLLLMGEAARGQTFACCNFTDKTIADVLEKVR